MKEFVYKNRINRRVSNVDKHLGYISNVQMNGENDYIITGKARGYVDEVIIVINFKDGKIITQDVNLSKETDLKGGLDQSDGSLSDLIDIGKGNRTDIVSNVTYTSVSLIACRNAIIKYIDLHIGGNNE